VLGGVGDDLAGYRSTTGSLQFAVDQPLPDNLVRRFLEAKMQQLGLS
jgi:hypothetical protein